MSLVNLPISMLHCRTGQGCITVNPWMSIMPQQFLSVIQGTAVYILDLAYGKIFDTRVAWS